MTPIFIHIPKAGGRTLLGVCYRQYCDQQGRIWKTKGAHENGVFIDRALERKVDDPAIIMGHLYWGIHDHIGGPHKYFTILRDPIRRTLSQYYHIRRSEYFCHDEAQAPIHEFMAGGHTTLMDNAQTRFISGINPPYGECDETMLSIAKDNLSRCVVGIMEEYDRSILHIAQSFGWRTPYYRMINRSKPYRTELSAEDRAALRRYNNLDLEVYAFAKDLFMKQATISQREADSLRRLNVLHQWRFHYWHHVKRPARSFADRVRRATVLGGGTGHVFKRQLRRRRNVSIDRARERRAR